MHKLYNIKDMIIAQLEKDADEPLTVENLKEIDTLAHAGKNLCKLIKECEEEEYAGRSYDPDYNASYARGRDSMGRFTRDMEPQGNMSRGMSRSANPMSRNSYARDDRVVEQLEAMMATAADDRTRGKFRELIREMRNA